jgi:isopentenyldiphosphate isomerase
LGIGETSEIVIVDKDNNIIGSMIDKDRISKKEIIHRAAVAVIEDKEGNILLQKRSEHKYVYPLYWDNSAGGIIKKGQTHDECILEQLSEELGLDIKLEDLENKGIVFIDHIMKEFIYVYYYKTKKFNPTIN